MSIRNHSLPTDKLLSFAEVRKKVGIGRSKIYQLITANEFPKPTKVGSRSLFSEREVDLWIMHVLLHRCEDVEEVSRR